MDERRPPGEGEGGEGWQPPEPSGPEPDLGPQSPAQPPPPAGAPAPQQPQAPQPQAPQQQPPPPAQPQAPPQQPSQQPAPQPPPQPNQPPPSAAATPPPPPGAPAPPPPGYPPQGQPPPPPGYPPQQPQQRWAGVREPGNGEAVAGFSLSVAGLALLFFSAGFSSLISLICCALGIFFGRRGRRNVDEGRTTKHLSLARAGFIVGIIGVVLAILATVAWTLIFVFADWDSDSGSGYEFDSSSIGRVAAIALRGVPL